MLLVLLRCLNITRSLRLRSEHALHKLDDVGREVRGAVGLGDAEVGRDDFVVRTVVTDLAGVI